MTNITKELNDLRICHFNAQSIVPHVDEFREFFRNHDYDVIAVSETWLSVNVVDPQICLPSFHLHRNDRKRRHGGGVAVFVRNTLSSKTIALSENVLDALPEFLIIELWSVEFKKVLLSVVYRPPHAALLESVEHVFEELLPAYINIVIIGDLDINVLHDTYESKSLNDFCNVHSLHLASFNATLIIVLLVISWL